MGRRPRLKRLSTLVISSYSLITPCGISRPFGLVSPTSGQVTNALLTRSPLARLLWLVRLACIKHAASVHPEPGSNSPQYLFAPRGAYVRMFVLKLKSFTGSRLPLTLQLLKSCGLAHSRQQKPAPICQRRYHSMSRARFLFYRVLPWCQGGNLFRFFARSAVSCGSLARPQRDVILPDPSPPVKGKFCTISWSKATH